MSPPACTSNLLSESGTRILKPLASVALDRIGEEKQILLDCPEECGIIPFGRQCL
jgi:hypothetical protein